MPVVRKANLTILSVNDVYEDRPVEGEGGLSELATLVKAERAAVHAKDSCLFFVNGDFLSASLVAVKTEGVHIIEILNEMEVDGVVFGNHEFDFGGPKLRERVAESNFFWLGSNVKELDGSPFGGSLNYKIVEMDGVKAGFFGLCCLETPTLSYPGDEVVFAPLVESAQAAVDAMRAEGADVIIGVTHISMAQDRILARKVKGIHLIIGGHDHQPMTHMEGETLIHKSGQNALWLGKVNLAVKITDEDDGSKAVKCFPTWSMLGNVGHDPDPGVKAIVDKHCVAETNDDGVDKEVVATLMAPMSTKTANLRTEETDSGNLVADALRICLGTELGMINGGFIRGNRQYDSHTQLTVADVRREMPFPRSAVSVAIKGHDLMNAMEQELVGSPEPSGAFPHLSGFTAIYDPEQEEGNRLSNVMVGSIPMDPDREYLVAMTEFMAGGGDGCSSFLKGQIVKKGKPVADTVIDFLKHRRVVHPAIEGRLKRAAS